MNGLSRCLVSVTTPYTVSDAAAFGATIVFETMLLRHAPEEDRLLTVSALTLVFNSYTHTLLYEVDPYSWVSHCF